jgi:hypothetical protein
VITKTPIMDSALKLRGGGVENKRKTKERHNGFSSTT